MALTPPSGSALYDVDMLSDSTMVFKTDFFDAGAEQPSWPTFMLTPNTVAAAPAPSTLIRNNDQQAAAQRLGDLFNRVQRTLQRVELLPPGASSSAVTSSMAPITSNRLFPIASAMLASVEACMDPWDAAAWVELATDKIHGSIPPEQGGARARASSSRAVPDAPPSSAAETLRMLEEFLNTTEVKHAAAVKGVREAQERQRMLFDPRVHTGSAEILSDLSRQEEKLHASLANIKKMASACKQQMLEDATLGGDATHAEPPVDTTMTEAADSDVPITKTPSARSARSARPRRASVLSASGGVTKHVAVQQAMSDDDEGGEGGTVLLREWLYKNFLHPYPTKDQKKKLAAATGLTSMQVSNYFINARVRIWRPLVFKMCEDDGSEPAQTQTELAPVTPQPPTQPRSRAARSSSRAAREL